MAGFNRTWGYEVRRTVTACAAAISAAALALAGCESGEAEPEVAIVETVSGSAGVAVADEPRAAMVGREVLGSNGNAIDAAVAMAFTMSVTLPSRVGLGGGGVCVVHKRTPLVQQAVVFLPGEGENGAAVPALARGMAALHARYGLQPWARLVSPAERLAAFGHEVSRAFRTDLADGLDRLDGRARQVFLRDDGSLPEVGDRISQPALATVLAGLRGQGAGYLHIGRFARQLAEAAREGGTPLSVKDLLDYRPQYAEPLALRYGDHELFLPPVTGGVATAQLWEIMRRADVDPDSPAQARLLARAWRHIVAETRGRGDGVAVPAAADGLIGEAHITGLLRRARNGAEPSPASLRAAPHAAAMDIPTAGFAAADRFGNVVACGLTMNGMFGAGRMAGGTGVLLAQSRAAEVAGAALAPAVVANRNTGAGYLAASAAGGPTGQPALARALARVSRAGADAPEGQGPGLVARGAGGPGYRLNARMGETVANVNNTLLSDSTPTARRRPIKELGETVSGAGSQANRTGQVRRRPIKELADTNAEPLAPSGAALPALTGEEGVRGLLAAGRGGGAGGGIVSLLYCPEGAHVAPQACDGAADPNWHGLAVRAQ